MVEVKRIYGWHETDDIIAAHQGDKKRSTVQEHIYHKENGQLQNLKTDAPKIITKQPRIRPECIVKESDSSPTITASNCSKNANNQPFIDQKTSIRRLTPTECERLQGFPDDWTKYGTDENGSIVEISDTQRYRMMGNAVTVAIVEIIARRLKD